MDQTILLHCLKKNNEKNIIESHPLLLSGSGCDSGREAITDEDSMNLGNAPNTVGEAKELEDCANSMDSFSGFLDQEGDLLMQTSVHYHHWLGFSLSDGYSCHGCVKQVTMKEKFT
jgi:hypothetical protein